MLNFIGFSFRRRRFGRHRRSSSSDSDSHPERKKKRDSSDESDGKSSSKQVRSRRGISSRKEESVKETLKLEPVKDEPPAPPTRLRRKPPSKLEPSEKVSLKRTV